MAKSGAPGGPDFPIEQEVFKVGDRVKLSQRCTLGVHFGTIVEIKKYGRCIVIWDDTEWYEENYSKMQDTLGFLSKNLIPHC
jgi:hypothetical protein